MPGLRPSLRSRRPGAASRLRRRRYRRSSASAETGVLRPPAIRFPHFAANDNSIIKFTIVIAGTNAISGSRIAVQGFSRTIDAPMEQTACVSFQTSPDSPATALRPCFSPSRNSAAVRAPGYRRVGPAQRRQRVGVASADGDAPVALRKCGGMAIRRFQHLAVAGLDGGEVRGEILEIGLGSWAGKARKDVIYAKKQSFFVQNRRLNEANRRAGAANRRDPVPRSRRRPCADACHARWSSLLLRSGRNPGDGEDGSTASIES